MPGPISIQCPKCRAKLKLKNDNAVGKKVPCPKCKKPFVVEAPPEPEDEFDDFGALDDFDSYEDESYDDDFDEQPASPRRRASASAGNKRGKSKGKKKRKNSGGGGLKKPLLIGFGVVAALSLMVSVGFVGVKLLGGGGGVDNKIDLTYLPPDAELIVSLQVADAWSAPLVQSMVTSPMAQMQLDQVTKQVGVKPDEIESVIFGATGVRDAAKGAGQQPAMGLTPNFDSMHGVAVVRTKIPIDSNKLNTGDEQTQTKTHAGQEYYLYPAPGSAGTSISLFLPESKTLVIGPEVDVKAAIDRGSKEERREDIDFINNKHQLLIVVISKDVGGLTSQDNESLAMLPDQIKSLTETLDGKIVASCIGTTFTDGVELEIQGDFNKAADAETARKEIDRLLEEGRQKLAEASSSLPPGAAGVFNVAKLVLGKIKVSANGTTFAVNASVTGSDIDTIKEQAGPMMMAGLMGGMGGGMPGGVPGAAVPGGGNFPTTGNPMPSTCPGNPITQAREAALRTQCKNNLKQIALAMHNHHDTYKGFPAAATVDKAGKPLLSWRVHVLPFLGAASLYDQFKLDEPWDSTHNKKLIAQMPAVFACPSGSLKPGMTTYLGVSGEKSIFNGSQKLGFRDVRDGTANTLMVVDADDSLAITWTKPGDLTWSADSPLKGLVGHHGDGFQAVFCDGHTRYFPASITAEMLTALFTKAGGEVVELP